MERTEDYVKLSLRKYDKINRENERYHKLVDKNFVEIHPCSGNYVVTKDKAIKELAKLAKEDIERTGVENAELRTKIEDLEHCIKAMYADLSRKDKKRYEMVDTIQGIVNPALRRRTLKGL